jgi:hypothetical protein
MFEAPVGRHGNQRSPAAALRFYLFEQTRIGFWMDILQACFSTVSCIMFIAVAYSSYDPDSVQDIEFFFTIYFFADFVTRLYIARDSLRFFFSLVSILDGSAVTFAKIYGFAVVQRTGAGVLTIGAGSDSRKVGASAASTSIRPALPVSIPSWSSNVLASSASRWWMSLATRRRDGSTEGSAISAANSCCQCLTAVRRSRTCR